MDAPQTVIPLLRNDDGSLTKETVKALSERARQTMTPWIEPRLEDPAWVRLEGPCPHCQHPMESYKYLVVWDFVGFSEVEGPSFRDAAVEMLRKNREQGEDPASPYAEYGLDCRCGRDHPDGNEKGCSARWRIVVEEPS